MVTGRTALLIVLVCCLMALGTLGVLYVIERILGVQSAWVRGLVLGAMAVLSIVAINMLVKSIGTH